MTPISWVKVTDADGHAVETRLIAQRAGYSDGRRFVHGDTVEVSWTPGVSGKKVRVLTKVEIARL